MTDTNHSKGLVRFPIGQLIPEEAPKPLYRDAEDSLLPDRAQLLGWLHDSLHGEQFPSGPLYNTISKETMELLKAYSARGIRGAYVHSHKGKRRRQGHRTGAIEFRIEIAIITTKTAKDNNA